MKRILVSIPKGAWEIISKTLKGKIGEKDSEIIRNIVLSYLSEKGYMREELKVMPVAAVAQVAQAAATAATAAAAQEIKEIKEEKKEDKRG